MTLAVKQATFIFSAQHRIERDETENAIPEYMFTGGVPWKSDLTSLDFSILDESIALAINEERSGKDEGVRVLFQGINPVNMYIPDEGIVRSLLPRRKTGFMVIAADPVNAEKMKIAVKQTKVV